MAASPPRPRVVTVAVWCWLIGATLLIVGGMLTATTDLPALYRGAGVLTAVAGAGLAFLAGRSRTGDTRFRRAAVALSLTLVVLVALSVVVGVVHILTLVAVIPLIVGTVLMTRPSASSWSAAGGDE